MTDSVGNCLWHLLTLALGMAEISRILGLAVGLQQAAKCHIHAEVGIKLSVCLYVCSCSFMLLFVFYDSHEGVSATSCITRLANVSCDRWVKWRVVAAMRNCASRRQHHRRTVQACVSRWSVGVTCPFAHCLACRKQATSVWKIWHAVTTWTSQICHHGITCVFA